MLTLVNQPVSMPPAPAIFTTEFVARLGALNSTARCLRAMGYHVISQDIRSENHRPRIEIAVGEGQSVISLLAASTDFVRNSPYGIATNRVTLDGVIVTWRAA